MDGKKVINSNFFKEKAPKKYESNLPYKTEANDAEENNEIPASIITSGKISSLLKTLIDMLEKSGKKSLIPEAERIQKEVERKKFSVAIVGEFSKGKSTFINKFFGKEFLPVGNLPTTALLTKIKYNPKEMLILCDYKGNKKKVMPLSLKSWDGLTADTYGNDPEGVVLIGLNSPWLKKTGIEIEDTPGAGDLDQKRAKILGDALLCDDGAIIAISATAALSMSERLFIEQRLISNKIPYLMLIITKLDQVPVNERADIIRYVKTKLSQWNRDIPVFIPYEVEIPDDEFKSIMGSDKIKNEIENWITDPNRVALTEIWLAQKLLFIIKAALDSFNEQQLLMQENEIKRSELIEQKKNNLAKTSVIWSNLRLEMLNRCKICYDKVTSLIDENKLKIIERLQYEASHSGNPKKWWQEDYPYRLKIEIMNMSNTVNNFVNRTLAEDIKWFNTTLENKFKTHVMLKTDINDNKQFDADEFSTQNDLHFENIEKKRNIVRIGTAVATIASYTILPVFGIMPIIATCGIGTTTSILSEKVFKAKIEKQHEMIKNAIAEDVPETIENATKQSRKILSLKYDEVINAAKEKESSWEAAQKEAIENSVNSDELKEKEALEANINGFKKLYEQILKI